eukprot:4316-Heterococcus_DN1.PRE.1
MSPSTTASPHYQGAVAQACCCTGQLQDNTNIQAALLQVVLTIAVAAQDLQQHSTANSSTTAAVTTAAY